MFSVTILRRVTIAALAGFLCLTVCAQEVAQAPAVAGVIHGTVKSGQMPIPGVSITAANTLTGKKVLSSTGADGSFRIEVPSRGRYVVRAELPAFAVVTKEVVINQTTTDVQADVDMVLLSRVPKTDDNAQQGLPAMAAMNGRTAQRLRVDVDQSAFGQTNGMQQESVAQDMPAMANSADAANDSTAVAGNLGQTQDFGRNIDDMRDRIEEMRARGELPNGPGPVIFGGPGGGGDRGIMISGPGGMGGGGGRVFRGFNINQPHGSIFYSFGNSALNAAPYSLNGAPSDKPDYGSNRFGATIGGPLKIPKLFDAGQNTFFFFNMFGTRASTPYDVYSTVPTLLQRSGDFSQTTTSSGANVQIFNPSTGLPFAGNKISAIDPSAAALLQFIPVPNQNGVQNYHFSSSAETDSTNIAFRVMHNFGPQQTNQRRRGPFGRNGINFGLNYSTSSGDLLRPFATIGGKTQSHGLNANAGYTISRGRLTNVLRASFNQSRTSTNNLFAGITNVAGLAGITGVSQNPADWGVPNLSFSDYQSLNDVTPLSQRDNTFQITDMIIWSRGKHNVRMGGDYRRMTTVLRNNTNPRGSFTFTGFATAERDANGNIVPGTGYDFADFLLGFAQQTSIQYSPNQYSFAANGWDLFVNDDWRLGASLTLDLGLRYEYVGPYTEAHGQLATLDVAPGFTAAVPVCATPSVPAGTCLFDQGPYTGPLPPSLVHPDRNNFAPRIGIAWKPFSKTVLRAGYGINYNTGQYRSIVQQLAFQPPFSFTQTNIGTLADPLTLANGFPATTTQVTNNYAVDPNYRLGYVQMWNVNIQREIGWGAVLNVGYIGSKGTALDMVRAPNRGPDGLLISGVQPFLWESSEGSSILHAGSVRVRKRLQKGISIGGTYTFSKSIDNASSIGGGIVVVAQNDLDLAAERGLSSFDQRHRFTGDYIIDLPFGEGRHWLTRGGPLARAFGDWEWSGSFTIASGTPFTARVLGNFADVARGTNGTLRADWNGEPIQLSDPTLGEWFNTAAFTVPPTGQFGSAGRNTIIGPGTILFNMSLSKTFPMKDMMGFEVRADANNIFNTPQFTGIDTVVNSPTFGRVISVGAMRTITLSMRYRF
jgi:hypothetical protein